MYSRLASVIVTSGIALGVAATAHAQTRAAAPAQRLTVTGWAGGFTDMGGFSQGDDFFQFDGTVAWGGGIHYAFGGGVAVGVDATVGSPDYTRFDRDDGTELGTGTGDVRAFVASGRLQGSPGPLGIFLTGGAGVFSWDVPEIGSNNDLALTLGIGGELRVHQRITVFGEYGSWWVYHEKDDNVVKNTARHSILRGGARFGVF